MDIRVSIGAAFTFLSFTNSLAMQWGYKEPVSTIKVYALPGLGGHKPEEQKLQCEYARMLFAHDKTNLTIKSIHTPEQYCDLGQTHTMDYISNAIREDQAIDKNKYDGTVILASSQAAAAVVKLISKNKLIMPDLKAIFFEGLFMSANDALYHSVHGKRPEDYKLLQGKPYIRWWAPYVARLVKLPHYKPDGDQPVHYLSEIPKEIPIVIIHGEEDQRVTHDDALVHYTQLRLLGKENVYLFSKKASPNTIQSKKDHINVLNEEDVPAIQALLRKLNILPQRVVDKNKDDRLLQELQPSLKQEDIDHYIGLYNQIHERHNMHVDIARNVDRAQGAAKLAIGAAALCAAVRMLSRNRVRALEAAASLSSIGPDLIMFGSTALLEYL